MEFWTLDMSLAFFESMSALDITLFVLAVLALFEIVVFTGFFLYMISNTIQHPDYNTNPIYIFFTILVYIVFRAVPLPFIYVALNVNDPVIDSYMPVITTAAIVILGIWLHVSISLPTFTMWFLRKQYGIGSKPLLESQTQHKFIVIVPVYNEKLELLIACIQSLVDQDYSKDDIEIHVSFDDSVRSDLYLRILTHLNEYSDIKQPLQGDAFVNPKHVNHETVFGFYQGVKLYVHKFPHGGKRHAQAKTVDYIYNNSTVDQENTIFVLMDSDSWAYPTVLHNLSSTYYYHPEKMALAGYMTCMSSQVNTWYEKFWAIIQSAEYSTGELARSLEMCCGTINCLPGSATSFKAKVLDQFADGDASPNTDTVRERYFGTHVVQNSRDYHRKTMGEDRYFTAILHTALPKYAVGFAPTVRLKTEPPMDFLGLIHQRRRWALSAVANETYMLTDNVIWKKFPLLNVFKWVQQPNRNAFFSQLVLTILACVQVDFTVPSSWIPLAVSAGIPLVLSYSAAIATGIAIGHWKLFLWHLPMIVVMSLVQLFIDFYAVFTCHRENWGGARHDPSIRVSYHPVDEDEEQN